MGNGVLAIGPKLPRLSSTLPKAKPADVHLHFSYEGMSGTVTSGINPLLG